LIPDINKFTVEQAATYSITEKGIIMKTSILNERSVNQHIILTAEIDQIQFDTISNAKTANDTIVVNFKMGASHYFKGQPINHYRTEFGFPVTLTCNEQSLRAVFDRFTIEPKKEKETAIYPRKLFNSKFLVTETVVDMSPLDED